MIEPVNTIHWGGGLVDKILLYNSLASTNDFARELILSDRGQGKIIWALEQTAGRGRRGRIWYSDQSSLTFSFVTMLPTDLQIGILPLAIGLGLVKSFKRIVPEIKIKWPNDLWVGRRKLGGILGETLVWKKRHWLILGIGLNVNKPRERLASEAISLGELTDATWCRLAVLDLALEGMEKGFNLLAEHNGGLLSLFRSHGNFLDRPLTIVQGNKNWQGVARDVLPDGRLLIEDAQGTKALMPDEISVRFPLK